MNSIELVQLLMQDLSKLSLKGVGDWEIGVEMAKALITLKRGLEKEEETKQKQHADAVEAAKARRDRLKREAEERGEVMTGGEIYEIGPEGVTEVKE